MIKKIFPMLFKWEIFEFDEEPLKIEILRTEISTKFLF